MVVGDCSPLRLLVSGNCTSSSYIRTVNGSSVIDGILSIDSVQNERGLSLLGLLRETVTKALDSLPKLPLLNLTELVCEISILVTELLLDKLSLCREEVRHCKVVSL